MKAYSCSVCGYLYDEESAEKNNEGFMIPFEELSPEWICPICSVKQELFTEVEVIANNDKLHDKILHQKNNF